MGFILGNPRSGTSLFRLMLNANVNIISPPECGFMQWWHEKYHNWCIRDNNNERLNEYISDILTSKKMESWNLNFNSLSNFIKEQEPKNYKDLSACVYYLYGQKKSTPITIVDKNNYYIDHLDWLKSLWPNARFLHLVRDGRDVSCSYREIESLNTDSIYKPKLPQKISEIAIEWTKNNQNIEAEMSQGNYMLVRYEDLILKTTETLKDVCDFLAVGFHQSMLNYYKMDKSNQVEPLETLDWKKKTKEKPDSNRIGYYKQNLSSREIVEFENIANKGLKKYEYIK